MSKLEDWKELTNLRIEINEVFDQEKKRIKINDFVNLVIKYQRKYQDAYNPIDLPSEK